MKAISTGLILSLVFLFSSCERNLFNRSTGFAFINDQQVSWSKNQGDVMRYDDSLGETVLAFTLGETDMPNGQTVSVYFEIQGYNGEGEYVPSYMDIQIIIDAQSVRYTSEDATFVVTAINGSERIDGNFEVINARPFNEAVGFPASLDVRGGTFENVRKAWFSGLQ